MFVLEDRQERYYSQDITFWLPYIIGDNDYTFLLDFPWGSGNKTASGEPGRHDIRRRLIEEPFNSDAALAAIRPQIEGRGRELVADAVRSGNGTMDLASEIAYPLALWTIATFVGLPLDRADWVSGFLRSSSGKTGYEQLLAEPPEVRMYFEHMVRDRLARPQGQLLDHVIAHWAAERITDKELFGTIAGLFSAGADTTGTTIANALGLLIGHNLVDEAVAQVDNDRWYERMVLEVGRFKPAFPIGQWTAIADHMLPSGTEVKGGTPVLVSIAAANRDPQINGRNSAAEDPNVFDVHRWPNRSLGFGFGMHYCVGARLAQLEVATAVRTILRYLPKPEIMEYDCIAGIVDFVTTLKIKYAASGLGSSSTS